MFYDGECRFCCGSVRRVEGVLTRRGFRLCPLQSSEAALHLGQSAGRDLREMRLLTREGLHLGGGDAVMEIVRRIPWMRPIWLLSRLPGAMPVIRAVYRVIAANRHCIGGTCEIPRRRTRDVGSDAGGGGRRHRRHAAFLEFP